MVFELESRSVNASFEPSGDHAGCAPSEIGNVGAELPSAGTIPIASPPGPLGSLANAMRDPSGDQVGDPPYSAIFLGYVPSAFITQIDGKVDAYSLANAI